MSSRHFFRTVAYFTNPSSRYFGPRHDLFRHLDHANSPA